jgi:hypothetical protein
MTKEQFIDAISVKVDMSGYYIILGFIGFIVLVSFIWSMKNLMSSDSKSKGSISDAVLGFSVTLFIVIGCITALQSSKTELTQKKEKWEIFYDKFLPSQKTEKLEVKEYSLEKGNYNVVYTDKAKNSKIIITDKVTFTGTKEPYVEGVEVSGLDQYGIDSDFYVKILYLPENKN